MADALPSWLLRETARNPRHSYVSVFVGPDADHRALAGQLILDHEHADDLFDLMGDFWSGVPRRLRVAIERQDPPPEPEVIVRHVRPSRPRAAVTTWLLEAFNTDRRYPDDVRFRVYTRSRAKAEAFDRIPKIQFSDSGHGIVFSATEVPKGTKRLPERRALADYVREHMGALYV